MAITVDRYTPTTGNEAGTPPGDRKFRPDVQGMRAIAILLALVYHANIPGFSGGYVGIEVFFVISGFVITGLLMRERAGTGKTSIRSFYGRRARRIIPAATLVIIVTVIASYHWLGPLVGHQTSIDGLWAGLFLSNVHFASSGTNYLAAQAPPSPLLNYWSLGVEEQFYLVYPTLFLFIAWWARKASFRTRFSVVLGFVIVASYTFSIVYTSANAQSAYYSLLTRSWELALGGLIALHGPLLRRIPPAWAAVASWVGMAMILVPAVTLNGSSVYPGALVAIPTLGAGLVIAAGASEPTWGVERLVALRPFQFIAAISFSLYLWHWPILEIAWQSRGVTTLPVWQNILLLLAAGVLATLTYYFFENPVRQSRFLARRRWASIVMGLCLVAATITVTTSEANRATVDLQALATPGLGHLNTGQGCPPPQQQQVRGLMGSDQTAHPVVARILLVGDSTACTMVAGLEAVGTPTGVQIENAAVIGCGVVSGQIGPDDVDGRNLNAHSETCQRAANKAEEQALQSATPNVVLWSSSWERTSLVVGTGNHQTVVQPGSPQWYTVLRQRMTARVREFTSTGATVYMLTQAPFWNAEAKKGSGPTPEDRQFERLNDFLTTFAAQTPHVRILNLADYICPSGPPCPLIVNHVWPRGDGAHYTPTGSLWTARWVMRQLGIPALKNLPNPLPMTQVVDVKKGGVINGTHGLGTTATFNLGVVAGMQFKITGATLKKAIVIHAYPVQHPLPTAWVNWWNTREVPNGTYEIRSIASNAAGDTYPSKGVSVKVVNSHGS